MAIDPAERGGGGPSETRQRRQPVVSDEQARRFRDKLSERRKPERERPGDADRGWETNSRGEDSETRDQSAFAWSGVPSWVTLGVAEPAARGALQGHSPEAGHTRGDALVDMAPLETASGLDQPGPGEARLNPVVRTDGALEVRVVGGAWDGLSIALSDGGGPLQIRLRAVDRDQRSRLQTLRRALHDALTARLDRDVSIAIEGDEDEDA